jgi:hypothetical protein
MDNRREPMETFYDGCIVNAIMDACYSSIMSKRWEPVNLDIWRGVDKKSEESIDRDCDEQFLLVKKEKMPDGRTKLILKDKKTKKIIQRIQK